MGLIEEYKAHTEERALLGVPPLPLSVPQTAELIEPPRSKSRSICWTCCVTTSPPASMMRLMSKRLF